jgi:proton-coupled amino acid transporter
VTLNLPHDSLTSLVQILYCFGLIGSYPMQMMPIYQIFETTKFYELLPTMRHFKPLKRLYTRTITVIFTAILAMIVPKFGLFINLIGSFACTALGFLLPVQIYNRLHWRGMSNKRKWAHRLIVVFGFSCGVVSFIMSISEIAKAFGETEDTAE